MRETMETTKGNTLVKHPEDMPAGIWRRVTIRTLEAGQSRPYADSRYSYLVTFEGGSPSTYEGYDLPFAIMPPPKPMDMTNVEFYIGPSDDQNMDAHWEKIRKIMRVLVHDWQCEKNDRRMGASWLEALELVEQESTHTTYRLVVISPYMD